MFSIAFSISLCQSDVNSSCIGQTSLLFELTYKQIIKHALSFIGRKKADSQSHPPKLPHFDPILTNSFLLCSTFHFFDFSINFIFNHRTTCSKVNGITSSTFHNTTCPKTLNLGKINQNRILYLDG